MWIWKASFNTNVMQWWNQTNPTYLSNKLLSLQTNMLHGNKVHCYEKALTLDLQQIQSLPRTYQVLCQILEAQGDTGACSNPTLLHKYWEKFWKLKMPRKIKNFNWKMYYNGIPTAMNLNLRNCQVDPTCRICGIAPLFLFSSLQVGTGPLGSISDV